VQLHIYRIVGSAPDAEDLVQETLFAAWRSLGHFEGRVSVRAWLFGIATNRSLDALRASHRRRESGAADDRDARADPLRRAGLA
jgi:RNA polymerase sigma-70 factor (ECF subfamily)